MWVAGAIYFAVIPLILGIIFLLSSRLESVLALSPSNPTILSMIGSNYLHTTFPHFLQNLVFYLVIMVFVFAFDATTNRKMLFVNLPLLFIALPLVSSLVNVFSLSALGFDMPCTGFSAIVAGVFGYLAFSTLHFIKENFAVKFERSIFQLMLVILSINLALISLIYGYYLALVLIAGLIPISIYYTRKDFKKIFLLVNKAKPLHRTAILVSFMFCLCLGIQCLFPETIAHGSTLTNILAHYVGYAFGFVVPAIVCCKFIK